jgi:hypothetical protein
VSTLHLTNWSSTKLHGPGRVLGIMARPRSWEHGDGCVPDLMPHPDDLLELRDGRISIGTYRARLLARLRVAYKARGGLGPGQLWMADGDIVQDGDTLCCACSRDEARDGRCHRVWVAHALARCGWRVVLDGVEVRT